MGHYASEMNDDWNESNEALEKKLKKQKASHVMNAVAAQLDIEDICVCLDCGALVLDYKKHRSWHIATSGNAPIPHKDRQG